MVDQNGIFSLEIASKTGFMESLNHVAKLKDLRVVILSFAGEQSIDDESKFDSEVIDEIDNFAVPIIYLADNIISGFSFDVLVASHLCIAAESAIFELSNKRKLESEVGSKNIEKLSKVDDRIDAKTAIGIGLINRVVKSEKLVSEAFRVAEQIVKLAPISIRSGLKAVSLGIKMPLEDGLKLESRLFSEIFSTDDMREGTRAFLEKRKPIFKGE